MNKAVFLDRDGVLNYLIPRNGGLYSPRTVTDFNLYPDIEWAISHLKTMNYLCFIVTNQPDISRGFMSLAELSAMHNILQKKLPSLKEILVCPHDDQDNCPCRKPKPGLILQLAKQWQLHLPSCWMIGDNLKDIQAGESAGCHTIFIGHKLPTGINTYLAPNLSMAVKLIESFETQ